MRTHKHSLSKYHITAMDFGYLYPISIREVLPGDTFQHGTQAMIRLQPMVAPTMHPVHATIEHYFVPNRIIYDDWETFITGGDGSSPEPVFPTINVGFDSSNAGEALINVYPYMGACGIPESVGGVTTTPLSALPARAYTAIFNEYYRDQDLVDPLPLSKASGVDTTTNTGLQLVAWKKDRFTTARPWAQKGSAVSIPVTGPNQTVTRTSSAQGMKAYLANTNTLAGSGAVSTGSTGDLQNPSNALSLDPRGGLEVILNQLGISPEDIRTGLAAQKWQEMRARYGSRYTEYLRAWGVIPQDSRLQRPEYLGGGSQTIQMSEVLQTSQPDTADINDVTGSLKGHGLGMVRSNAYRRFFPEHGYVVSVMHIRPINIYGQGIDKTFLKRTKFDFYTREFEHVGAAAVANAELFCSGVANTDTATFGYQDQYYDYRSARSYVSGQMANTYSYWHLARFFTSTPTLNDTFVNCIAPDRIFAAPVDQNFMVMIYDKCVARRLVTKVGSTSNLR